MGFNIQATIGADGSGFFRELGKIEASAKRASDTAARETKVAADATRDRIALEQRLALLKKGEVNLSGRLAATQGDDDLTKRRAASSVAASAAVKSERAERERVEKEATRATRDQVTAASSLARLEASIAKQRERAGILAAAGDTAGSEKALLKQTALEGGLVTAKARVVLATHEQAKAEAALASQIAARGKRLTQLENRAAKLDSAAASAKAGSEAYDRLAEALKRVQKQAAAATTTIASLNRTAGSANAAAAAGTAQASALRAGKVKAAAVEFGGGLLGGFGGALGAAGAGVAIAALAHKTIEYGGTINDLSARLGVSTDALQELDYAMTLNGATLADATSAMQKLGLARTEALKDGGEKMDAFKALGISVDDLKNKRLEDLFKQVGRAVRDAADVQLVLGDAIQLMGKGSGSVLAAMRADLEAAAAEARRLGLIIGPENIAKLDDLGDSFTTLGKRMMAAFAGPLLVVSEIVQTAMDGVAVLMELLAMPVSIPARIAGAIAGGASPAEAARAAFAETNAEIERITARQAARREQRTLAPRGEESLGLGGDGTPESRRSVAVADAARILGLRERIAKMDRDQLPLAERRAALEKEIAKLREEEADLNATAAEDTAAEEQQLKIELQRRELEKELQDLNKPDKERAGRGFDSQQDSDSKAKRGLFIGAGPSGVTVAPLTGQQATREFTRIVQTMERLITVSQSGHGRVEAALSKFV